MVDLLVFSASWCGPCLSAERAGVYQAVEEAGYPVTKIDVDQDKTLANSFSIRAMPTLVIRKNGVEVRRIIGVRDKNTLIAELQNASQVL